MRMVARFIIVGLLALFAAGCAPAFKPLPPDVASQITLKEVRLSATDTVADVFNRGASQQEVRQAFERGIVSAFAGRQGNLPVVLEIKVLSVDLPTAGRGLIAGAGSSATSTIEVAVKSENGQVILPSQTLYVTDTRPADFLLVGSGVRWSREKQIEELGKAVGANILQRLTDPS
jgi:hypothetical protein